MIDKQIVAILLLYAMRVLFLFQADGVAAFLVLIKSSGYKPTGLIIQSTTSVNPLNFASISSTEQKSIIM